MDKRNRPRADPPKYKRGKKVVQVHLDADDYRKLYELTMESGLSMNEAVRRMIRQTEKIDVE